MTVRVQAKQPKPSSSHRAKSGSGRTTMASTTSIRLQDLPHHVLTEILTYLVREPDILPIQSSSAGVTTALDHIVSFLHSGNQSLHRAARSVLYETLIVPDDDSCLNFPGDIEPEKTDEGDDEQSRTIRRDHESSMVKTILLNPFYASCVRKLTIVPSDSELGEPITVTTDIRSNPIRSETLLTFLTFLPGLRVFVWKSTRVPPREICECLSSIGIGKGVADPKGTAGHLKEGAIEGVYPMTDGKDGSDVVKGSQGGVKRFEVHLIQPNELVQPQLPVPTDPSPSISPSPSPKSTRSTRRTSLNYESTTTTASQPQQQTRRHSSSTTSRMRSTSSSSTSGSSTTNKSPSSSPTLSFTSVMTDSSTPSSPPQVVAQSPTSFNSPHDYHPHSALSDHSKNVKPLRWDYPTLVDLPPTLTVLILTHLSQEAVKHLTNVILLSSASHTSPTSPTTSSTSSPLVRAPLINLEVLEIKETVFVDDLLLSSLVGVTASTTVVAATNKTNSNEDSEGEEGDDVTKAGAGGSGVVVGGLRRLRRLSISNMWGTKLTERGVMNLLERCESLEWFELDRVEARFSKTMWAKIKKVPKNFRGIRIVYSEEGSHHSWVTDHLSSILSILALSTLPSSLETLSITRHVPQISLIFPSQSPCSTASIRIPSDQAPKLLEFGQRSEGRLKVLEIDFWEISLEGFRAVLEGFARGLEVFKVCVDSGFGKIVSQTTMLTPAASLRSLNFVIPQRHLANQSSLQSMTSSSHGVASSPTNRRASLSPVFTGPPTNADGNATTKEIPTTSEIRKFVKKATRLEELGWLGRYGVGVWRLSSSSSGSGDGRPKSGLTRVKHVEFESIEDIARREIARGWEDLIGACDTEGSGSGLAWRVPALQSGGKGDGDCGSDGDGEGLGTGSALGLDISPRVNGSVRPDDMEAMGASSGTDCRPSLLFSVAKDRNITPLASFNSKEGSPSDYSPPSRSDPDSPSTSFSRESSCSTPKEEDEERGEVDCGTDFSKYGPKPPRRSSSKLGTSQPSSPKLERVRLSISSPACQNQSKTPTEPASDSATPTCSTSSPAVQSNPSLAPTSTPTSYASTAVANQSPTNIMAVSPPLRWTKPTPSPSSDSGRETSKEGGHRKAGKGGKVRGGW